MIQNHHLEIGQRVWMRDYQKPLTIKTKTFISGEPAYTVAEEAWPSNWYFEFELEPLNESVATEREGSEG